MGDLAPLLGGAGVLGVLGLVIMHLLSSNRADRQQYQDFAAKAAGEVVAAETREAEAWAHVEEERRKRWAAEDREAELARKLRALGGEP